MMQSRAPQHLTNDRDLVVQECEVDPKRRRLRRQRCILHALPLTQRDHRLVRRQRARAWHRREALKEQFVTASCSAPGRKCPWGGRQTTYAGDATADSELKPLLTSSPAGPGETKERSGGGYLPRPPSPAAAAGRRPASLRAQRSLARPPLLARPRKWQRAAQPSRLWRPQGRACAVPRPAGREAARVQSFSSVVGTQVST